MHETKKIKSAIFIIGNGFDLHHGYKTSYGDFLKDEQSKQALGDNLWFKYFSSMAQNGSWVDIETEFKKITELYTEIKMGDSIPKNKQTMVTDKFRPLISLLSKTDFFYYGRNLYRQIERVDLLLIQATIDGEFVRHGNSDSNGLWLYDKIDEKLESSFYEFEDGLFNYLERATKDKKVISSLQKFISEYGEVFVINFNYSATFDAYKESIPSTKFKVHHVHGKLSSSPDIKHSKTCILGHNHILQDQFTYLDKYTKIISTNNNEDYGCLCEAFLSKPEYMRTQIQAQD